MVVLGFMSSAVSNSVEKILRQLPISIDTAVISSHHLPLYALLKDIVAFYGLDKVRLNTLGTILELVRATLELHRHVADGAERDLNNKLSILSGDFLFSRALILIAKLDKPQMEQLIFKSITLSVRGDLLIALNGNLQKNISLRKYLRLIEKYQASLYGVGFALIFKQKRDRDWKKYYHLGCLYGLFYKLSQEIKKYQAPLEWIPDYWDIPLILLNKKGPRLSWKKEQRHSLSEEQRKRAVHYGNVFFEKHLKRLKKKATAIDADFYSLLLKHLCFHKTMTSAKSVAYASSAMTSVYWL